MAYIVMAYIVMAQGVDRGRANDGQGKPTEPVAPVQWPERADSELPDAENAGAERADVESSGATHAGLERVGAPPCTSPDVVD